MFVLDVTLGRNVLQTCLADGIKMYFVDTVGLELTRKQAAVT